MRAVLGRLKSRFSRDRWARAKAFATACDVVAQGDLPLAYSLLKQCVADYPEAPEHHEALGNVLIGLGQPEQAIVAFQRAIALDKERPDSHHGIGVAQHQLGQMAKATRAWGKAAHLLDQIAARVSPDVRYLSGSSWTAGIGHIALLDYFAKMTRLGLTPHRYVILADRVANSAYLSLWKDFFEVIADPQEIAKHREMAAIAAERPTVVSLKGEWKWIHDAMAEVETLWNAPPLLALSGDQIAAGREACGVPEDAWFVALHIRESNLGSVRDADPLTYVPAIRDITSRGGWVVRLGDPGMTRLPGMPRLIDFTSRERNEWADVYALSQARLFVGTNSGPAWVAGTFGVRSVLTNWAPMGITSHYRDVTTLKKRIWSEREGRLLSDAEAGAGAIAFIDAVSELAKHGLALRDNSPDEIRQAIAAAIPP